MGYLAGGDLERAPDSVAMKYISNSRMRTFQRCPKRYEFKYVYGLEPRLKKIQLEKGSWVHELLEVHYKGGNWVRRHKELVVNFNNLFEEQREELGNLPDECARIMRSYLRYWGREDEHFTVVDAELDEIVTLPSGIKFRVIIDLIVEDHRTGLLWPWDHKTRAKLESPDGMLLDPQLTNYYTALEIMGYTPLGGVCYNEICTKPPAVPALLKKGGLTKRKNIDTDLFTYYNEIRKHGLDPADYRDILRIIAVRQRDRFFRRTRLPKDPPMLRQMRRDITTTAQDIRRAERTGRFRRTFIPHSCKWDCDFKSLCIAELHGGDLHSLIKSQYRPRKETDEVMERK